MSLKCSGISLPKHYLLGIFGRVRSAKKFRELDLLDSEEHIVKVQNYFHGQNDQSKAVPNLTVGQVHDWLVLK